MLSSKNMFSDVPCSFVAGQWSVVSGQGYGGPGTGYGLMVDRAEDGTWRESLSTKGNYLL